MKDLRTFIFTYDRYDTISTSRYLQNYDHKVLCHTKKQAAYFDAGGNCYGEIIATGQPKGLSNNRNWALKQMKPGEWAVFWVDDLIEVTRYNHYFRYHDIKLNVTPANQAEARKKFKCACTAEEFYKICHETIEHAERKHYALCGFSLTDNPLFRRNKYSYRGLADGRCWLVKKTDLRFDENVQLIDDTCFTALNIKYFGGVVVNNWLLPKCHRYTAGAFGTIEQRMAQKKAECKYLVETYPQYIRYADKAGWPEGSHVQIR